MLPYAMGRPTRCAGTDEQHVALKVEPCTPWCAQIGILGACAGVYFPKATGPDDLDKD